MNRARPVRRGKAAVGFLSPLLLAPSPAEAHVSEQAFVLLLPTEHYIVSGAASVLASIILISLTPESFVRRLFTPVEGPAFRIPTRIADASSVLSMLVCAALVCIGFAGPRDPLTNLLPLAAWTGFWIAMLSAAGLIGGYWRHLNPWSGPYALLMGRSSPGMLRMPDRIGVWPGLVVFALFSGFYIADPAPQDPDRLALVASSYWILTFLAMLVFGGKDWLERGEAFTILFGLISKVSPFGDWTRTAFGFPGWSLVDPRPLSTGLGAFALLALGVGSFDGLKETFWWLGLIGVNPLEFPGRSAVVVSSLFGMAIATAALFAVFLTALWLGSVLAASGMARRRPGPGELFRAFAPALLPIALGYHISHFTVSFLINGQYLLAALGDPLANGGDFLGLGQIRVTTGFLNTRDSVQTIWLSQAAIVVAGHIVSVLVSHAAALRIFKTPGRAALSQIPIGAFMVAYTLFGLWLLASPRGA